MPRGGYQQPSNPAPVSGPGRLSRRTDGGPASQTPPPTTGMPYGENAELDDIAASAPLAAASPPSVGFGDPTTAPDEPVTAGNPLGPGPGPEALPAQDAEADYVAALVRYAYAMHPSPQLRGLINQLEARGR